MPLADAYQQQLGHWRAALDSGAHRIGWKVGLNPPAVMEALGLERPVVGHLTSATLVGADGTHSLAGAQAPKVEPELLIEVGPDGSVAGLAAAIELVDLPAPPGGPDAVPDVVATNIFHRAVVIGPSKPAADLADAAGTLTVSGESHETASPATVDVEGTIAMVAATLEEAGESLQAGDRIISGTLRPPPEVAAGDLVTFDLGPLGRVDLSLTA